MTTEEHGYDLLYENLHLTDDDHGNSVTPIATEDGKIDTMNSEQPTRVQHIPGA